MSQHKRKTEMIVPLEYAGKWIVWDEKHTKIIASGASLETARKNAVKTGKKRVWYDKAPAKNEFFGGALLGE